MKYIKMKIKLLLSLLLAIFIRHFAFTQDTIVYEYEGKFDYALLEGSCLYFPYRSIVSGRSDFIKKKQISGEGGDIIHYSSGSEDVRLPYVWVKNGDNLFVPYFKYFKDRSSALMDYRPFETRDTVQ